jgi:predicted O-linked N-acetylglucosamine transferase (SPINDLY family)
MQARIAAILSRAMPSLTETAPHCREPLCARARGERIRIGFVSCHFYAHTISKLNLGVLRELSREHFEVVVFRQRGRDDPMAASIAAAADHVVELSPRLPAARDQIAAEGLDALYYTDIGMEPMTYFLAFARLAPVQCVTWGHPLTTGIPNVDYFLSSEALEPADAEQHYTERLVRLPTLTNFYYPPRVVPPIKTRGDFGLDEAAHLYLVPQSLFKLHPEYDSILAAILQADPRGRVVLLEGQQPHWTRLVRARFARSLGVDAERVDFVPRQPLEDFHHLLAAADVMLDPIHFGGGDTSYEGFAAGVPIVTMEGPFLRSRITYALYRQMGIDECVARSADEYVRIAVRLATNREHRAAVCERICPARPRIYENREAVRDLERFLVAAVEASRRV